MKRKVTNRLGLPRPIVHAVQNDPYNPGTGQYTITQLLEPARAAELSKNAEVVEDAADLLYSMQGQVMHLILERAGDELKEEGYIVEKRFYGVFSIPGFMFNVSAQVDLFDPISGIVSDYKYTSVASSKYGLKEDHRLQLNFQAELLRRAGFKVEGAEVVLLLRDWSAERVYEGYPKSPVLKQNVPLMTSEEIIAWTVGRIQAHESAKVELPLCTTSERWNRPTFATMKPGAIKATRVFDDLASANAFIAAKAPSDLVVVERPGVDVRCMRYCPARSVCSQAKELLQSVPVLDEDGFTKVS